MKNFLESAVYNIMGIPELCCQYYYRIDLVSNKLFVFVANVHSFHSGHVKHNFDQAADFQIPTQLTVDKEILADWLLHYLAFPTLYRGYMVYEESDVFTEVEFKQIKEAATKIIEQRVKQSEEFAKDNILIKYMEDLDLYPRPSSNAIDSWFANCPSGRPHRIDVSTSSNQWGCGYCGIKGGLVELQSYIAAKKVKTEKK